mgnify:FL=1
MTSTSLKRTYADFRGVDFLNEPSLVATNRSPDALNVWKNYKDTQETCIETRPGYRKIAQIGTKINGIYLFNLSTAIVHSGNSLYEWSNFPSEPNEDSLREIYNNMNSNERTAFNKFGDNLYINDGSNYILYDGNQVREVKEDAFIPRTTIGRKPTGGGETLQDVNVLQPKRTNSFLADGTSTQYVLDAIGIDSTEVIAVVNDITLTEGTDFTVNRASGIVTFNTAPAQPSLAGTDNVFITFSKTVLGYEDRIKKCTKATIFDSRIFYTGNPEFPNAIFHCELNNPAYISDLSYYEDGSSDSRIKDIVVGSNVLWVFKDLDQNNANVFYHEQMLDETQGAVYPCKQGNVSTSCYARGINFKDDIVYISRDGLEGITTENIDSRQAIAHRSSLVDSKMINNSNYSDAQMVEWQGYLLILVGGEVFLADSRQKYSSLNSFEYEWYYWDISNCSPRVLKEYKDKLYIGANDGSIFIVEGTNDNEEAILSYWTTPMDNFGYDNKLKTTNKRGGIVKIKTVPNGIVKISRKINTSDEYKYITQKSLTGFDFKSLDFRNFSFVTTNQSYVILKIKEKKINEISLKFYSDEKDKPFGLFSAALEAFIGGYIKK